MKLFQIISAAVILAFTVSCTITSGPSTKSFESTKPIDEEVLAKSELKTGDHIVIEDSKICFLGLFDMFSDFSLDREKILDKAMKKQSPDCIGMKDAKLEAGMRLFLLDLIAYKWYKYEADPLYLVEKEKTPSKK